MGFNLQYGLAGKTYSAFGMTELGIALAIFVLSNSLAYALAKALSLDYGRLLAGVIVLFVAFMLYATNQQNYSAIFLVGISEVIIGLLDVVGAKLGTPIQDILDPNTGAT